MLTILLVQNLLVITVWGILVQKNRIRIEAHSTKLSNLEMLYYQLVRWIEHFLI